MNSPSIPTTLSEIIGLLSGIIEDRLLFDEACSTLKIFNYETDYHDQPLDYFTFSWTPSKPNIQEAILTSLHNNTVCSDPVFDFLQPLDQFLKVENYCFYMPEDPWFFIDESGEIAVFYNYSFTHPFDEDSDTLLELLSYEGVDVSVYSEDIYRVYYDIFIKYNNEIPPELRKPVDKLSQHERDLLAMFLI